ncbi:MAG: hypothetical protein Q7S00_05765, partial [bacterium]|nr:hypothetical protein [bacterium]
VGAPSETRSAISKAMSREEWYARLPLPTIPPPPETVPKPVFGSILASEIPEVRMTSQRRAILEEELRTLETSNASVYLRVRPLTLLHPEQGLEQWRSILISDSCTGKMKYVGPESFVLFLQILARSGNARLAISLAEELQSHISDRFPFLWLLIDRWQRALVGGRLPDPNPTDFEMINRLENHFLLRNDTAPHLTDTHTETGKFVQQMAQKLEARSHEHQGDIPIESQIDLARFTSRIDPREGARLWRRLFISNQTYSVLILQGRDALDRFLANHCRLDSERLVPNAGDLRLAIFLASQLQDLLWTNGSLLQADILRLQLPPFPITQNPFENNGNEGGSRGFSGPSSGGTLPPSSGPTELAPPTTPLPFLVGGGTTSALGIETVSIPAGSVPIDAMTLQGIGETEMTRFMPEGFERSGVRVFSPMESLVRLGR